VQTSWRCRTSLTGAGKDHAAARIGRVWAEPRGERPLQGGEWRSADLGLIAQRLKQGSTQGGGCLEIFVVCGCGWVGRRWIGTETLVVVFIYLHTGSTCQLFTGFTSRAGTSTKILYPQFYTRWVQLQKPIPIPTGMKWHPYPHPTGFLPTGTQVICAHCHPLDWLESSWTTKPHLIQGRQSHTIHLRSTCEFDE